jgi:hypothetical protein
MLDNEDDQHQDKSCPSSIPTVKAKGRKTESRRSGNGDEKTPEEPKIPFPRKTGGTGTIGQVPHRGSGIGRFRRLRLRRLRIGQSAVHATFQRGLLKLSFYGL